MNKPPTLTASLIVLAVFSIAFGGCGVWAAISGYTSGMHEMSHSEFMKNWNDLLEGKDDALNDNVYLRWFGPDQEEIRQFRRMMADPIFKENVRMTTEMVSELFQLYETLVPDRTLFLLVNLLLSLMALAGGAAMLNRADWGRQTEIVFLFLATLVTAYMGFKAIPPLAAFAGRMAEMAPLGGRIDPEVMQNHMKAAWSAICLLFALMHGGIIWYLMRPSVRAIFEKPDTPASTGLPPL